MNKTCFIRILTAFAALLLASVTLSAQTVIDRVVWMVGDEPILLSDIEYQKLRMRYEGVQTDGRDPDCFIAESIAAQMLFLNQAKIDSITIDETMVNRRVDAYLQGLVAQVGSKAKLEEYFNKKYSQIKEDQRRIFRNNDIVSSMQEEIVKSMSVTPGEIRTFYESIPQDSVPFVPARAEVQLIVRRPEVKLSEIDRIKERLRGFASDINSGKSSFSTLARLYSQDAKTASAGGEYGFVAKSSLENEFARIVFALKDTEHVSPIIQTEEGYHIVQLIEKRGDIINFRHILLRPELSNEALEHERVKLDSIASLIATGALRFEDAVTTYSQDDKTKNNSGLLVNEDYQSELAGSSLFALDELPQDISRAISSLRVGELSPAFVMINDKGNKQLALVRLAHRYEAHRANLQDDFRIIKNMALADKKNKRIDEWIREQQKTTFIEVDPSMRHCDFRYPGWIKTQVAH